MNMQEAIVKFPAHYKEIPHPFYVLTLCNLYIVAKLDGNLRLIEKVSKVNCDRFQVRRWALKMSKKE